MHGQWLLHERLDRGSLSHLVEVVMKREVSFIVSLVVFLAIAVTAAIVSGAAAAQSSTATPATVAATPDLTMTAEQTAVDAMMTSDAATVAALEALGGSQTPSASETGTLTATGTETETGEAVTETPSTPVGTLAASELTATATPGALPTPASGTGQPGRYVMVVGQGTVDATPEIATVELGVESIAPNLTDATSANTTAMNNVMAALAKAGIDSKDIRTSNYSIYLEQGNPSGPEPTPTAVPNYHVTNMVIITVRKLDTVGAVLDSAVAAGANRVFSINFTVSDWAPVQAKARELAMADAISRAKQLVSLAGAELGEVISISEVITGTPVPTFGMAAEKSVAGMGGGAAPISPGQLQYTTSVQVVFAIR